MDTFSHASNTTKTNLPKFTSVDISTASTEYVDSNRRYIKMNQTESALTGHHDAAKLCPSQDVNNLLTFWLHQVLHHQ